MLTVMMLIQIQRRNLGENDIMGVKGTYRVYKQWQYRFRTYFLYFTFIGVMVHEFAHKQLCDVYKIPVLDVCYFQLDSPPGYVKHKEPLKYRASVMISIAPVIINTLVAFAFAFISGYFMMTSDFTGGERMDVVLSALLVVVAGWGGFSCGCHLLPSREDTGSIWKHSKKNWYNPLVIIFVPVTILFEILNRMKFVYLDIIFGVGIFLCGWYLGYNYDMTMFFIKNYLF